MNATDELFALLASIGATPTLYGVPVTARELKTFAWSGFVDRYADRVIAAALRAAIVPPEPMWSPYP